MKISKKLDKLQEDHEDERHEIKNELKSHDVMDLRIIKKQINEINRIYSERDDFVLKMYKIVFKNSATNRLDLNISFTINNEQAVHEDTFQTKLIMLRDYQKKETLRELTNLINVIHYMTTKSEYESMIDQSK